MKRAILITALALALALVALSAPSAASADPTITYSCSPAPTSCKGWYRQPVTIDWDWSPGSAAIVAGCKSDPIDFDTGGTLRACKVTDGVAVEVELTMRVDMTRPVVTGVTPSRPADFDGWYRSPLQVSFAGTDALSGLDGCSSGTYSGPDAAAAQVRGHCWDRAGNVSAPGAFDLRYDANAPSLAQVIASGRDHKVRLEWNLPDAANVDVHRGEKRLMSGGPSGSVVDRGLRNGHRYEYVVSATDAAGNSAKRTFAVVPGPHLFGPPAGARLVEPPLLSWTSVRGADYYNVQLFRGRRKILSVWPTKPRLQLHSKWRYAGDKRRLKPGKRYRWFVWPGEGSRSQSDYGRLIGARTFVITP
jgi:hypothetical protein